MRTCLPMILPCLLAAGIFAADIRAQDAAGQEPSPSAVTARQVLSEAHAKAVEQVLTSSRSRLPRARANAIEAVKLLPDRAMPMLELALGDPLEAVRFTALVTAGELKLAALKPAVRPLLKDESKSVRAAAIFALHQFGEPVDLTPFARMLASQSPTDRSNAAMLLGMMGERSAAPMLVDMARVPLRKSEAEHEVIFRLQVAEAVVKLLDGTGDEEEIELLEDAFSALRAGAWSRSNEARVFAVLMMGRLGDARMEAGIRSFLKEPPIELQLAAAEYTARLGRPEGQQLVLAATNSTIAPVRAQAALVLAHYEGDRQAAERLVAMLSDGDELVRLSAAASILKSQSRVVAAEDGVRR